ncbi:DUF5985 family protein [Siccirubricoccus sp. G192]|uniref:DUF5985 family protein n=1 Tax=Siccirubricoccus sp. G192 TaxID=2849651 RepID=UPI001C2BF4DA|nr:DUF5985 family protein [Siccirubricoccus sp. G192]MBV1797005.1 hypothetical protein [Siccirubricoccus sp. G192]
MRVFPAAVYLLCAATSLCCLALLTRSYLHTRSRLLLWSALSFVGFTANNLLVFIDLILLPAEIDLLPLRNLTSLAAIGVLLYGFIWETS